MEDGTEGEDDAKDGEDGEEGEDRKVLVASPTQPFDSSSCVSWPWCWWLTGGVVVAA